jgi:hypothetical protein
MVLIVIIGLAGLLFVFQIYTSMATQKSEKQNYSIVKTTPEFEIRFYPASTMAMITSTATSYKELGSFGLKKLAGYIFGGKTDNKQISMTAPVHMDLGDSVSTMSFVMPSGYNVDNLPLPDNSEVTIKSAPDEYVAAIRFGGFASNEDIKKNASFLISELNKNQIFHHGHYLFLGYNPPYLLFGRRNEIIVAINWPVNQ